MPLRHPRGDKYELTRGLWDGLWDSFRTCHACVETREEMGVDCWTFGGLYDEYTDPLDMPTEHGRRLIMRWQLARDRRHEEFMEKHWRERRGVGRPVEVVGYGV